MLLVKNEIYSELTGVCARVNRNYVLARLTTFGIGGPAEIFALPQNADELQAILRIAERESIPFFILGGGSNILISDAGLRGIVIKLAGDFNKMTISEDKESIEVGAGVTYPILTTAALNAGWKSALGWYGTPGTVGGALKMNAGTSLGEIGEVIETVEGIDTKGSEIFPKSTLKISYRHIEFPRKVIITRARLKNTQPVVASDLLMAQARELRQRRKESQPKLRCAGSIFKNPPGNYAGRLIEQAGLKGAIVGKAEISTVHANFIVNNGGATARDVYELAKRAQNEVYAKYRIKLEFEVKLAGEMESWI